MVDQSVTMTRLDDQIAWYAKKCHVSKKRYVSVKLAQLAISASIPLVALFAGDHAPKISAVLGALLVAGEGIQQLGRYHENWLNYRATAEALKQEKYLFLAGAGAYASATAGALRLLAERVESLVSQENLSWASTQRVKSEDQKAAA